jgi:hypothetical protein
MRSKQESIELTSGLVGRFFESRETAYHLYNALGRNPIRVLRWAVQEVGIDWVVIMHLAAEPCYCPEYILGVMRKQAEMYEKYEMNV